MPDWDMNGDTTRSGYEARIASLQSDLAKAREEIERLNASKQEFMRLAAEKGGKIVAKQFELLNLRKQLASARSDALADGIKAIVDKAHEIDSKQCCGNGVPASDGQSEECCGDPLYMISSDDAANVLRALDKPKGGAA
jgi:hypothetical protein